MEIRHVSSTADAGLRGYCLSSTARPAALDEQARPHFLASLVSSLAIKPFTNKLPRLKKAEIIPTVLDSFRPKLALDVAWKDATAHVGNTVDPDKLQESPEITLSSLNHGEGSSKTSPFPKSEQMQLTIALTDPDAPSRENPEWAQICHWIATTSPPKHVNAEADLDTDLVMKQPHWKDIMPYKPPGPPPKTGKHRYVFVVLAPINGTKEALHLVTPADRQHWGYEKAELGLREWADEMGLEVLGKTTLPFRNRRTV